MDAGFAGLGLCGSVRSGPAGLDKLLDSQPGGKRLAAESLGFMV